MSFFKKRPSVSEGAAGGGDSSMFGITLVQFKELMELRGKEFVKKLNSSDYNGVQGILEKLKVDRNTGLHSNNQQDLEQRRTAYGKNIIPQEPQSFLSFLTSPRYVPHHMLLVILLIYPFVLIDLSFSKSSKEKGESSKDELSTVQLYHLTSIQIYGNR
ncbi:unnamed protein product [Rotaria sp. Silwood1]|nr:unnamed protein product [Rotaria sp. Silwood1]CAF4986569.1 unnamed protein product [Rotaria sp. Silwood1]